MPVMAEANIDYAVVRRYWDEAAVQAFSASYMAHEQGLPDDCVRYRFEKEKTVVDAWFASAREHESVLDLGCGSGTWPIHFASVRAAVTKKYEIGPDSVLDEKVRNRS